MAKKTNSKKFNKGIALIKKSNGLIESRYKFDIWETRIFLSILAQIRKEDRDFHVYRIWYKDVIKTFELKSGDSYRFLRAAAQSLMGKSFFVNYEENGVIREKQYHILREIDYLKEGQKGKANESNEYIDITIEEKMKPLLLQLQRNFTAYDLRNIVKLGMYPVRIYELLKQYQSIGSRKLDIEEIKRMLEITDRYKLFADFNRWIIKPAIKEINANTDLTIIQVDKIKEGRRVVAINFRFRLKKKEELEKVRGIKPKKQKSLFDNQDIEIIEPEKESKVDLLFTEFEEIVVNSFGVTPSVFIKILSTGNYTKEAIEQAINVTRRAKYNQEIRKNVSGFFIKALKEGFTDIKEEAKKTKKRSLEKQKEVIVLEQEIASYQAAYTVNINDKIRELNAQDPTITHQVIDAIKTNIFFKALITKKEQQLERPLDVDDYRNDKQLRSLVIRGIVEQQNEHFKDITMAHELKIQALEKAVKALKG